MMKKNLAMLFATAALLAACGGDDGPIIAAPAPTPPAPPPVTAVPDSAFASVDGFITYMMTFVMGTDDTTEPLTLSATIDPPVTETAEPTPLP